MTLGIIIGTIVLGTSIWVLFDSMAIDGREPKWNYGPGYVQNPKNPNYKREINNTSPFGWFLFCLVLWIVGFPLYLSRRPMLKAHAAAKSKHRQLQDI
jgi:hypothetical protein